MPQFNKTLFTKSRCRRRQATHSAAALESLESRQLLSATNVFPSDKQTAIATLLAQESPGLSVKSGQIFYGGEATRLVAYGDYGMLAETDFEFEKFFDKVISSGTNMVRVWLQYQWAGDDGLSPFAKANGKYDLTSLSDEFFNRLKEFTSAAEQRGVVVQLTLFDVITLENDSKNKDGGTVARWSGSPFNPENQSKNNAIDIQGNTSRKRLESFVKHKSLWDSALLPVIEKTIETISDYHNVVVEVMNEPEEPGYENVLGVRKFHKKVAKLIRDLNANLPIVVNVHGTAGLYKWASTAKNVDILSIHARSESDDDLNAISEFAKASQKPVIISNDGDLSQVNSTLNTSAEKKPEDREMLIKSMMKAGFKSDIYGHAHIEILDKGLNGASWLTGNYELDDENTDPKILQMLEESEYVNHHPVARRDRLRAQQDQSREFKLVARMKGSQRDTDPDGDRVRVVAVTEVTKAGGTVELVGTPGRTQRVKYTPPPGYSGQDVFWYSVTDGHGGRSVTKANISVRKTVLREMKCALLSSIVVRGLRKVVNSV